MYYPLAAAAVACYVISRMYRRDNAAVFLLGLFLIHTTGSGEIAVAATQAAGMFGELAQLFEGRKD